MNSGRNVLYTFGLGLFLALSVIQFSCRRKVVCPAFQSTYILNDSVRHQRFSLFGRDTIPRYDYWVSKNRYGVVERTPYKRKFEEMKTIPMETIFPKKLDSLGKAKYDSLSLISVNGELPPTRFNMDQEFYLRLFGEYLPQPKDIVEELTEEKDTVIIATPVEEKPKKGLFRKKKKIVVEEEEEESESIL